MIEYFENYLASRTALTKEEISRICSQATTKKLRRRQLLLHEGEICRHKVFVCKGLLRTYCVRNDGAEYTMRFAPENWWTLEPESYNNQIPTRYNIEALEESAVLLWRRQDIEVLFDEMPNFRAYSERLRSASLDASQDRILMSISYTAEEKYRDFTTSYPDVFRRVPLHMVASYLGVSRETLSRIRQAQHKKQRI